MAKKLFYISLLFFVLLQNYCIAYDCPQFYEPRQIGTVQNASANEISGIVASRKNTDVFWVHNDHSSSTTALIYAMTSSGKTLGTFRLNGAVKRDYEDIAIGPGPVPGIDYIYVGDIGDNNADYNSVIVYRIPEPIVDANDYYGTVNLSGVDAISLKYPAGARDAETLMVDPNNADIYIITKRINPTQVYKAAYPQSTTQTTTLSLMTTINTSGFTGGDISPDGKSVIITSYLQIFLWPILPGQQPWQAFANQLCAVPVVAQPQREAICFSTDSRSYYTTSEGNNPAIYFFQQIIAADFNLDKLVNFKDFALLADCWFEPVTAQCLFVDLQSSPFIDYNDLQLLTEDWLKTAN